MDFNLTSSVVTEGTLSPEILDRIYGNEELRQYLGVRLGEMACVIRQDHAEALSVALGDVGIHVEIR